MQRRFAFEVYNPARNQRYYALTRLGSGGQGGVWAGVDTAGNPIALKVIWPTSNTIQDYWSWYNDQAGHLECLQQPHVVLSYDQFQNLGNGWYVIVMERANRSLDDVINSGWPQSALRVCEIGAQILSALDYLHSVNRVHRDVSARNLLEFPNGLVKLNDFGVSKAGIAAGQATGTQLGNAVYLPPELLSFGRWTHQSDIYQLGLVLISLLLGRHVIPPRVTPHELGRMIRDGVPRQAAESIMGKHANLGNILKFMVCRTEHFRFPTAAAAWTAIAVELQAQRAHEQARRESLLNALKLFGVGAGLAWIARTAGNG